MTRFYSLDASHRIYPIRGLLGYFHLLYSASCCKAVLIDTGLVGEMAQLSRVLREIGLDWPDIKAILLTHGHIDHTGNLAKIKQLTGAPLFAHPGEQPHINGTFAYRGASRVCGVLEAAGRWLLRYQPVDIDEPISSGMDLPFWGGLRVIHLPGHTQGHCGFYHPSRSFPITIPGSMARCIAESLMSWWRGGGLRVRPSSDHARIVKSRVIHARTEQPLAETMECHDTMTEM